MALVAANHSIGVLVIDEIQRLSLSKSGGVEKMLNFFVQLVNTVGVPVVLVGTYKSLSIFEGNFSQMRRGTGQGDLVWDRMKLDNEWELFLKSLWYFQYTRKTCSLKDNPNLTNVLYEETQGITDLAVKAYMLAQERAIETGKEIVTDAIIRSVAKDKFRMLEPALKALKSKTKNALARYEDAYPQYLGRYIEGVSKPIAKEVSPDLLQIEGEIASAPEIISFFKNSKKGKNTKVSNSNEKNYEIFDEKKTPIMNFEIWLKEFEKSNSQATEGKKGVLPAIFASLENVSSKTIYQALKDANFIRSSDEFIK